MDRKDLIECKTIPDLLYRSASMHSQTPFLKFSENGRERCLTYKDFLQEVVQLASWLTGSGIAYDATAINRNVPTHNPTSTKSGIHIALAGRFSYAWILWYFAILLSGNTVVSMNPDLSEDLIRQRMRQTNTCMLAAEGRVLESFHDLAGCLDIERFSLPEEAETLSLKTLREKINGEKLAMLAFTSGTTGSTKVVMLTHDNLVSDVYCCVQSIGKEFFQAGNVMISFLPAFHMFQVTAGLLAPIWYGMTLALVPDIRKLRNSFVRYQPSSMIVVPTILDGLRKMIISSMTGMEKLLMKPVARFCQVGVVIGLDLTGLFFRKLHQALGGRMKALICGGAALDPDLWRWFKNAGVTVLTGYGSTECSPVIACSRKGHVKAGSVGFVEIVSKNYRSVRIRNGELYVKGKIVSKGYYGDPDQTREVFQDGWFKTGDRAYIDSDGYLFIKGRINSMLILRNGNNVSAEAAEEGLMRFDEIQSALVYKSINNENVEADVYLNGTVSQERLSEILEKYNAEVPPSQCLLQLNVVNHDFSRTALGKIKRYLYLAEDGRKKL